MGYLDESGTYDLINKVKGQLVELTLAQYVALTEAERNNGNIYFVTDVDGGLILDNEPTANSDNAVKSSGIYQYTSKIGSGSLTTESQTLISAVNEVQSEIDDLNSNLNGLSKINSAAVTFIVATSRADIAYAYKRGNVCSLHFNNVSFSNSYTSGDIVLGTIPYKPNTWVRFMGYTISGNPVCLSVRDNGDVILSSGLSSLNAGTLIYASCCFVCQ